MDCFTTQCKKNSEDYKIDNLKGDYSNGRYMSMENLG
jgi:hypothetical protein